jgi:hypothetical protein
VTIEAGALSLRITETGGDQVEAKLARIDNKARAIGSKTVAIHLTAPGIERLDAQLDQLGKQAQLFSSGSRFASTRAQSLRELGAVEKDLRGIIASGITPLEQRIRAEQTLASLAQKQPGMLAALSTSLGKTFAAYMAWGAVTGVYNAISAAADRQEVAQMRLGATAKLTGQSLATITAISERAQSQFSISAGSAADLTQQFVKLASRAGNVAVTGELMTRWMDLAAAQGLSITDVLTGVNTTLAGQDEGLNRLGLANPSQIWAKWADAVGAHNGQLTEQQKWLAIVNEVMAQGETVRGSYSQWLETTPGKQQQLNAEIERTSAAFGAAIAPARIWAYEVGTAILSVFNKLHQMKDVPAFLAVMDLFSGNAGRAFARMNTPAKDGVASVEFVPTVGPGGQTAPPRPVPKRPATAAEIAAAKAAAERAAALARAMAVPQLGMGDIGDGIGRTTTPVGVGKDGKMQTDTRAAKQLSEFEKKLDEAMERIRAKKQQMADLVMSIGQSIGSALGDGFTAAFSKSGDQNFFEAFGKSLLASLGNIVMQLGSSMLTYGLIASTFSSLLAFTPFAGITAGAGASIAAGIGLIALGAGMGAIAGGGKGGGAGGGGGSSKTAAPKPDEYAVAFDPDRKLRKNSGSAVGQTSRPLGNAPMPDARPVVNIGVLNTLTPDNAQWQRTVVESYNNGIMRGMKRAG